VAEGLTQASREAVKGCLQPVEWLGMFLRTPGTAPAYILNAIFQSRSLKYFDYDYQRQDANMAHFGNSSHINVEEGMSYEEFEAYFDNRQKLGTDGFDLLRGLGIEVSSRSRNTDPQEDEVENYDFDDHNRTSEARKVLAQMDTNQRNSLWSRTHTANTQLAEETKADRCLQAIGRSVTDGLVDEQQDIHRPSSCSSMPAAGCLEQRVRDVCHCALEQRRHLQFRGLSGDHQPGLEPGLAGGPPGQLH